MKKIISIILVLMLVLGMTSTAAFAKSDKNNAGEPQQTTMKKLFFDSDQISWAQKAIEKLGLKGLIKGNDGKFQPHRSVTELEAIIMCLRVMGWENEALQIKELPRKYKGHAVSQWAVGYIDKAYEKGILDDVDMMYFNPNTPVKRYEIAKYIIRALQKDDEAKAKMDAELPFVDAAAVPQGAVGYVYMINKLKIMQGTGKRFNPMGTLSRAEMAVLFNNLDDKVDNDNDTNEFRGLVYSISSDEITLKIGALKKTFDVCKDVVVYQATKQVDYSDVAKGARVIIKTDGDVVQYIEILTANDSDEKIITNYTGTVTAVTADDHATITVKIEQLTAIFKVADAAEFYFKGIKGTINDLKVGDEVSISVDDSNRALKVVVDRELDTHDTTRDSGKITAIDLTGTYHLSIDSIRYILSKDAVVKIDNHTAELEDLEVGMDVTVDLEDSVVEAVYAEN